MRAIMGGGRLGTLPTASITPNAGFNTEPEGGPPVIVRGNKQKTKKQNCETHSSSSLDAARDVLSTTADVADVLSLGFEAAGITAPAAIATKFVSGGAQVALLGVNSFDAWQTGNTSHLQSQVAGIIADPLGLRVSRKLRTIENVGGKLANTADRAFGKISGKVTEEAVCTVVRATNAL